MNAEHDTFFDLAQRIESAYPEIDNDITLNLKETNAEYAALRQETLRMQENNPVIAALIEGSEPISLTAADVEVFQHYLDLERQIEDIERRQIYFRGHSDSLAYLIRIGTLK